MSFLNIENEENDQNMQYLQRQLSPVGCQSQSEIEIHRYIEGEEVKPPAKSKYS